MFKAYVYITLKPSVLDPQGNAIKNSLDTLGISDVTDVRVGKYMELSIDVESRAIAEERLQEMCEKILTNPVIENYRYELKEV